MTLGTYAWSLHGEYHWIIQKNLTKHSVLQQRQLPSNLVTSGLLPSLILTCKQCPEYLDMAEVYLDHELNKATGSKGILPDIYLWEGYRLSTEGRGVGHSQARTAGRQSLEWVVVQGAVFWQAQGARGRETCGAGG